MFYKALFPLVCFSANQHLWHACLSLLCIYILEYTVYLLIIKIVYLITFLEEKLSFYETFQNSLQNHVFVT